MCCRGAQSGCSCAGGALVRKRGVALCSELRGRRSTLGLARALRGARPRLAGIVCFSERGRVRSDGMFGVVLRNRWLRRPAGRKRPGRTRRAPPRWGRRRARGVSVHAVASCAASCWSAWRDFIGRAVQLSSLQYSGAAFAPHSEACPPWPASDQTSRRALAHVWRVWIGLYTYHRVTHEGCLFW